MSSFVRNPFDKITDRNINNRELLVHFFIKGSYTQNMHRALILFTWNKFSIDHGINFKDFLNNLNNDWLIYKTINARIVFNCFGNNVEFCIWFFYSFSIHDLS